MKTFFAQYGEVASTKVIMDNATRKSKGFGFVQFTTKQAALDLKALKRIDVQGKMVRATCASLTVLVPRWRTGNTDERSEGGAGESRGTREDGAAVRVGEPDLWGSGRADACGVQCDVGDPQRTEPRNGGGGGRSQMGGGMLPRGGATGMLPVKPLGVGKRGGTDAAPTESNRLFVGGLPRTVRQPSGWAVSLRARVSLRLGFPAPPV